MRKRRIKYLSRFTTKGIEVDQVLVRYFKYSPEIQKNIEAKKLQDQMVFTNRSAARAAKETDSNKQIITRIVRDHNSKFLATDFIL